MTRDDLILILTQGIPVCIVSNDAGNMEARRFISQLEPASAWALCALVCPEDSIPDGTLRIPWERITH
jgi:hypothetical protein